MTNTWMNDPAIAHIDKSKRGQDHHITFSNEEIDTIIDTIKKYSTPEELDRINKMLKMRKR